MSVIKQTLRMLMKPILRVARVERVADVGECFRLFELAGEGLKGPRCAPGDKVQVMIDGDFRTYTPFAFDGAAGQMSLLAFLHGDGPGARWAGSLGVGDDVHLFGPRGSLPLRSLGGPVVLIGDETSLAVGRALGELGLPSKVVLEVRNVAAAMAAAEAVGLHDVSFIARSASDAHVEELWTAAKTALKPESALVLTGKAQTIQSIRRLAQRDNVKVALQKNKAYWAPGKRGLD